ncbi:MAG: prolipoprotein diacylglyceryl transferase [Nanoarchaeota archaeon]|nr:prolipoprotein diacylglyceryl transferase [Nanoarchaeota archaeon]
MLDPVIFSIFGIEIYWYGLFYVIGFLFAYFFILKFSSEFGFSKEKIEDIIFWTMLFGILGGRLGHILFYDPIYYFSNLSEIIRVDKGGMSIHGGLIGAIVTLYYFSWKDKLDFLKLTDLFVIPTALALAFGRLANFINQELVGNVTSSSLGVVFPLYDDKVRWPSTIFESIKNMITFQILIYLFFFNCFYFIF